MKEIKAYIQRSCVDRVVSALQREGAPGITIVETHPVGYGYEPNYFDLDYESKSPVDRYRHLRIVNLEVVCSDDDLERFIGAIEGTACTGSQGDGRIFVSEIVTAVRVRDGARGREAL